MKKSLLLLLLGLTAFAPAEDVRHSILANPASPYFVDFAHYPKADPRLPVGVFDSGTGGLTVLNAIVQYDEHNNQSGADGADGKPDFASEDMIYLADQANMPYGNYPGVGKTDLLLEHILKCAQFLLGSRYYADGPRTDKKPIKAMVIACNTATAYGFSSIVDLLKQAPSDLKVIGVIDAGSRAALSSFRADEDGSIGIFATAGTVSSNGYVTSIEKLRKQMGYTGQLQTYSQGGVGLAESIDEEPDFIDHKARSVRKNYRGPSVDPSLLAYYRFDQTDGKMLCEGDCLQMNASENYARYHIVSLVEQMRKTPGARPLKALILGCTHYPYVQKTIAQTLDELRAEDRYKGLIADRVVLIDPSVNTARELYRYLYDHKLQNTQGSLDNAEFYISVPNPELKGVQLEANGGRFTYDYKYGRAAGQDLAYVRNVPFSRANISEDVAARLRSQIPVVYRLIQHFDESSPKTAYLKPADRL
ncbi:aspartate/glutamate racemase family protein [bacterium]|nr:aspartate/glutamate racemase family protein [bacterium]